MYNFVKATYGQAYLVGQHAEASANSKIYIFRIGGEGEHTNRLQNIHSDANILQLICVFTLSAKPKNEYFAICTRTVDRRATTSQGFL